MAIHSRRPVSLCASTQGSAWPVPRAVTAWATATPSSDSYEDLSELVLNQRLLLNTLPGLKCTIAGVSFEGRQEHVKLLRRMQPVLLLPDPSNKYDNNAVEVRTLTGTHLGYVPRAENLRLSSSGPMPAFVLSAGQARADDMPPEDNPWGAFIWTSPLSVPLLPLPLPRALRPGGAGAVESEQLRRLRQLQDVSREEGQGALQDSEGACELTATQGSSKAPLQLVPLWQPDFVARTLRLLRLVVACAPVARAFNLLYTKPGTTEYEQARRLVEQFNKWRPQELDQYMEWARAQEQLMDVDEANGRTWEVQLEAQADVQLS